MAQTDEELLASFNTHLGENDDARVGGRTFAKVGGKLKHGGVSRENNLDVVRMLRRHESRAIALGIMDDPYDGVTSMDPADG